MFRSLATAVELSICEARVLSDCERRTLSRPFHHDGGYAFVVGIPADLLAQHGSFAWDDEDHVVLEEGITLGLPTRIHDEIRNRGGGCYSIWGETTHFSSSDGSDSRTNGRRYELARVPSGRAATAWFSRRVSLGFVGNTNNIPYFLCEAARAVGFDAVIYPLAPGILHDRRGKQRATSDGAPLLPEWVRSLGPIDDQDLADGSRRVDELVADVRQRCDFVIYNGGLAPRLSRRIGLPFAFLSSGSDVTYYANYECLATVIQGYDASFRTSRDGRDAIMRLADAVTRQRDAILGAAAYIGMHPPGLIPEIDRVLSELSFDESWRLVARPADLASIDPRPPRASDGELVVCSPVRADFRPRQGSSTLDYKGTERLIRGFARYLREGGSGRLVMAEKGHDVDDARDLVEEQGIADRVRWVSELPFMRYLDVIAEADLVCDAVSLAGPAQICHEAYALGRPVLGNLRPEVFGPLFGGDGYPGLHVATEEDVAEALAYAESARADLIDLGQAGRAFAERHLRPEDFLSDHLGQILASASVEVTDQDGRGASW